MLSDADRRSIDPALLDVVEYRKSGLSLNHVIGCPLDCGYCVRHLFDNFAMKQPRALMGDEEAVQLLVGHRYFQPDVTPVQFFNRATDPFLPVVKPHTFAVLAGLDARGLRNHVLVITRWRVTAEDCAFLNSLLNVRLTLLVTHSGIDDHRIEPVDSQIAARSLQTAYEHADRYRVVLYWRPVVPGLNDTDRHIARARQLSRHAHAVVFTGLFYRAQIQAYYREMGLPEPYQGTARRKVLPADLEARILAGFGQQSPDGLRADLVGAPLFRKTSCGVTFAHGLPDYNGHYGIRELCDICPVAQLDRCAAAHLRPNQATVNRMAASSAPPGPRRSPGVPSSSTGWTSSAATTSSTAWDTRSTTAPSPTTTATTAAPRSAGPAGTVTRREELSMPPQQPVPQLLAGQRLVVVDVEGNGQQPPEVVELAAVTIEDGMLGQPRSWLVKPRRPITPLVTRKVHGIRNADVAAAPAFAEVRDQVAALLGDAWLVAHNARVEHGILTPLLPGWEPRGVLDTLRLARAVWPGRRSYGLDALLKQEALDPSTLAPDSHRHRAAYDAAGTALLLLCLLADPKLNLSSLERVAEVGATRSSATPPTPSPDTTMASEPQQGSLWTPRIGP
jgi:DNA polymerase III epsilon subunit-like protein/DNA repair photolyase